MKIAITDDNTDDIELLSSLICSCLKNNNIEDVQIVKFTNGTDLLKCLKNIIFDIIFLDIYMTGINGIETAEMIRSINSSVKIVFITTSNDFASESFNVNASHYILKPIDILKIDKMLRRVLLEDLEHNKTITLPDGQHILLRSIMYTMCNQHIISFYLNNGLILESRIPLYLLEEMLSKNSEFIVSSKGVIVNQNYVHNINGNNFTMIDNTILPISRRRRKDVLLAFNAHLIRQLKGE